MGTLILFIAILAILVFVHELGHFLVAKRSGIRVDEFGLGFPPRIWGIKKGETLYSINAIPFGGFVKIFGENPDEEAVSGEDSKRSFINQNRMTQAAVLVAGVTFNLLFAWFLFALMFMVGFPASAYDNDRVTNASVMITSVRPDSPAMSAGITPGDTIERIEYTSGGLGVILEGEALSVESVMEAIQANGTSELLLTVSRGGESVTLPAKPEEGIVSDGVALGVSLDFIGTLKVAPHVAIGYGFIQVRDMITMIIVSLSDLFVGAIKGEQNVLDQVTGPVGIVGLVGDASRLGWVYLINFTAMISIHLAIINLVPFPALDGGRLLFVGIEAVTRKRIPMMIANYANAIGFFILLGLMFIVTISDIARLSF
ncbi:MAG: site-2 protease family protein [Candidatus Paceibacterota bacterium]